jgi:hypothetical protein
MAAPHVSRNGHFKFGHPRAQDEALLVAHRFHHRHHLRFDGAVLSFQIQQWDVHGGSNEL